jgi:hypothetical protein
MARIVSHNTLTFQKFQLGMAAVRDGVGKGIQQIHAAAIRSLYVKGRKLFRERTNVPPYSRYDRSDSTATVGGTPYRKGARATTRFKFGDGKAFEARIIDEKGISGFGWPVRAQADAITDHAWRVVEFGTDKIKMPAHVWMNAAGVVAPSGEGAALRYTRLAPISSRAIPKPGSRFVGKHVLEDALDMVAKDMPEKYRALVVREHQRQFGG